MAMAVSSFCFSKLLPSETRSLSVFAPSVTRTMPSPMACSSNSGNGGCCGGNGGGGGGGSCSSHSSKNSLANLGKEFEHLVATNTILEFEKEYISAPMEGNITRDIIDTVKETNPEVAGGGQKFLDINEILEEATIFVHVVGRYIRPSYISREQISMATICAHSIHEQERAAFESNLRAIY